MIVAATSGVGAFGGSDSSVQNGIRTLRSTPSCALSAMIAVVFLTACNDDATRPDANAVILAISPDSVFIGDAPRTLVVTGVRFPDDAVAEWNGVPRQTRVLSSTSLEVDIESADVAMIDSAEVTIRVGADVTKPFVVRVVSAPSFSCAQPGTTHTGQSTGTWALEDSPHHVAGTVTGSVNVEAGALVCAAPGAMLHLSELTAAGSPTLPIRFTATDSTAPWFGMVMSELYPPVSRLEHVVIEHTLSAAVWARQLEIRHAILRRACIACDGSYGAISGGGDASLIAEDVEIIGSGSHGIHWDHKATMELVDVRIIDSERIGLHLTAGSHWPTNIRALSGVRISGSGSYPILLAAEHLETALAAINPDSLTGNAIDAIAVRGRGMSGGGIGGTVADGVTVHLSVRVTATGSTESSRFFLVRPF